METEDEGDPPDGQGVEDTHTTAYIWDSMDEEDRENTMATLKQLDEWVIWKTKDKWTTLLTAAGFKSPPTPLHQKGYPRGLLGIQDQRMVANRGHPGQKTKKDIRMLGEKQGNNTTRSTGHHDNGTPNTQSQLRQRRIRD